jgi:hypothetical protein
VVIVKDYDDIRFQAQSIIEDLDVEWLRNLSRISNGLPVFGTSELLLQRLIYGNPETGYKLTRLGEKVLRIYNRNKDVS